MCQIFIRTDPDLYRSRSRSMRLRGVSTSIRLENLFWRLLEEIGARDGLSVPQLVAKLYDELSRDRRRRQRGACQLHVIPAGVLHALPRAAGRRRDSGRSPGVDRFTRCRADRQAGLVKARNGDRPIARSASVPRIDTDALEPAHCSVGGTARQAAC